MANRKVTLDVSDNIIAAAVMASSSMQSGSVRIIEPHASDAKKITVNKGSDLIPVKIGNFWFLVDTATHVDSATDIDTGSVAAGTEYNLYAVTDGSAISFKTSLSGTNPTGYDAAHSKRLGGFSTDGSCNILAATIWDVALVIATPGCGLNIDGATLKGGTNTFSLANGNASLDVAAGATVDINESLTLTKGLAVTTNAGTLAFAQASKTLTVADTASVAGTNTGDQPFASAAETIAGTEAAKSVSPVSLIASRAVDASFWGIKNLRLIDVHPGDNTRVIVNPSAMNIALNVGDHYHIMTAAVDVDSVDDLDTGSLAAGTDYYIYACTDGTTLSFKVSANSTNPSGFDTSHSRKIGGFHTLCTAVGTISGHSLTDFAQKDILPASIWDLKHRAKNLVNVGLVYDSAIQKWVDIYLASGTGTSTTSVNGGTISDTRDWMDFVDDGHAVGKRLPSDHEFSSFAAGSNEETNIDNDADPGTTGGHIDSAHRRMISNIGCEDCCGAMYQWLLDQGWYSRTEGWYNLPGAKGSSYDSGDCKLLAGGNWNNAADAGSRCRNAYSCRWYTASLLGARFVAEPL